jgi:hypothetical protein
MDDIVRQAMLKWPHVPDCYGWLGLDARGNWYMRDDGVQALGAFAGGSRSAKGSLLQHEKLIAFIQRNYGPDDQGRWFFQNGPQRVYVELEATPWVWRVQADFSVQTHSGQTTLVTACLLDEHGWLYLDSPLGLGLVHTQDVFLAAEALEAGVWTSQPVRRSDLPGRYRYVMSPAETSRPLPK